jgi:hypothetical protein
MVELFVAMGILAVLGVGLSLLIRQVGSGVRSVEKILPVQRDLQFALQVVVKDLAAAYRSSVLNVLPNVGFEAHDMAGWAPAPDRQDPLVHANTVSAAITGVVRTAGGDRFFFRHGRQALALYSGGASHSASGPIVNLTPGEVHMISGWVRVFSAVSVNSESILTVLGNGVPVVSTGSASASWRHLAATFTAVAGVNYQVVLSCDAGAIIAGEPAAHLFDDVSLSPLARALAPGDGRSIEFDRLDPSTGGRVRLRYSLMGGGLAGTLRKERVNDDGSLTRLLDVKNIRSLSVAWIGGQADTPLGTERGLDVAITAGGGAAADRTQSAVFAFMPGNP